VIYGKSKNAGFCRFIDEARARNCHSVARGGNLAKRPKNV
jgi:hypothetical protein